MGIGRQEQRCELFSHKIVELEYDFIGTSSLYTDVMAVSSTYAMAPNKTCHKDHKTNTPIKWVEL